MGKGKMEIKPIHFCPVVMVHHLGQHWWPSALLLLSGCCRPHDSTANPWKTLPKECCGQAAQQHLPTSWAGISPGEIPTPSEKALTAPIPSESDAKFWCLFPTGKVVQEESDEGSPAPATSFPWQRPEVHPLTHIRLE